MIPPGSEIHYLRSHNVPYYSIFFRKFFLLESCFESQFVNGSLKELNFVLIAEKEMFDCLYFPISQGTCVIPKNT